MLATLVFIVVYHGGAMAIAGERVSGTSDVARIAAYHAHPGLLTVYWLGAAGFVGLGFFAVGLRSYLTAHADSAATRTLIDVATVLALAEIPLLFAETGMQAALVQLTLADPGASSAQLALFASWDWTYNGLIYWLEFSWVGLFSLAALRSGALPRGLAIYGLIVAAGLFFNNTALVAGIPDAATLPATALFTIWFIANGVYLVRSGRAAAPDRTLAAAATAS